MIDPTDPTLDTTTADEMPEEPAGLLAFIRQRIQATAEPPELPAEDSVDEPADDECSEDVPDSGEDEPAEFTSDERADAQWLQDNWDDLADREQLEVSVGGMRLFLRERLAEALSEPASSDDAHSGLAGYYGIGSKQVVLRFDAYDKATPSNHEEE